MTKGYQGPAWPCPTSVGCRRQDPQATGHQGGFSPTSHYATNWFSPRTLYQGTSGLEWCIRSPARIAPKSKLVSLGWPWNTDCLNTIEDFRVGMWLHLPWQITHGPLATVWIYQRLKSCLGCSETLAHKWCPTFCDHTVSPGQWSYHTNVIK